MMIYFFGPDGAGKTTHAILISSWLRERGFKVWKTSVKFHHMLSYVVLKLLCTGDLTKSPLIYKGFSGDLAKRIRVPWILLEFVSLALTILYRVIIPMSLGYVVVCDRYVLDTLVTLSYFLKDPRLLVGRFFKIMVGLLPKDVILLYLDAETKVLLDRKRDEPLSHDMINYYRISYNIIIRQLRDLGKDLMIADTSEKTIGDVHRVIVKYLTVRLLRQ